MIFYYIVIINFVLVPSLILSISGNICNAAKAVVLVTTDTCHHTRTYLLTICIEVCFFVFYPVDIFEFLVSLSQQVTSCAIFEVQVPGLAAFM